jgi:protein required for attachment to host cells
MANGAFEWILTANGSGYRLFTHDKKFAPLQELRQVDWPAGRAPGRELSSDRPGRSFDSAGHGRHAMEPRTGIHEEEENRLARDIAQTLADAGQRGEFRNLVIISAPRLLGHLRDVLPAAVKQSVQLEIDKDLTGYDAAELTDWLRREVWER